MVPAARRKGAVQGSTGQGKWNEVVLGAGAVQGRWALGRGGADLRCRGGGTGADGEKESRRDARCGWEEGERLGAARERLSGLGLGCLGFTWASGR